MLVAIGRGPHPRSDARVFQRDEGRLKREEGHEEEHEQQGNESQGAAAVAAARGEARRCVLGVVHVYEVVVLLRSCGGLDRGGVRGRGGLHAPF